MNVVYQAEDGTIFTKKEDCLKYEQKLKFDKVNMKEIIKSLKDVKEICSLLGNCSLCPFWNNTDCVCYLESAPQYWAPQNWNDKFLDNEYV